jgi:hypothetical protein
MKKGKELKIKDFKDYNISYGCIDNKKPKALYITLSSWVNPKINDDLNYSRVIKDIDKAIRQSIFNFLNLSVLTPFVKDRTIVDFDIRKSGIKYGKKSFLNCEITLFMKSENPINSPFIKKNIDIIVDMIINDVFIKNEYFYFNKRKK